ncbi:hypothetical protein ACH4VM_04685 [Streptomyces sp. NPDC020792]|uniref:hypothetical protein n=1 Tax=Streptomyces sp. NPDC020792 TaxID=3365089 RepID=UPI003789B747
MRVRDALGPLFTDTDFTSGSLAGMFSELGLPGLSSALLLMVVIHAAPAPASYRGARRDGAVLDGPC